MLSALKKWRIAQHKSFKIVFSKTPLAYRMLKEFFFVPTISSLFQKNGLTTFIKKLQLQNKKKVP